MRPNPSLEWTATGKPLGPRTGQCHHPSRGPSAFPASAPSAQTLGRMTAPTPTVRPELTDSWRLRAKASVAGGAAAALVAPVLFWVTLIATPSSDRGFWTNPSDVLVALPAVWLFASLVSIPASILTGPVVLAGAARVPRAAVPVSIALGAMLGALVVNALPLIFGARSAAGLPLSLFAAAMGATASGVAAAALHWLRSQATAPNAA